MNIIHTILIFLAVLFIYLQIQFYYKINNDTDIYELNEDITKKKFDKLCDNERSPFLFYFYESDAIVQFIHSLHFTQYNKSPIFIRQTKNIYVKPSSSLSSNKSNNIYAKINSNSLFHSTDFRTGMELISMQSGYVSERNNILLKTLQAIPFIKKHDKYLSPDMCNFTEYDMLFGSTNSNTPLRYEINQRTFFLTVIGDVRIKLMPPNGAELFNAREELNNDNKNMEYWSAANIWNLYGKKESTLPCIYLDLPVGKSIYIPPFWFYSIQFTSPSTKLLKFSYRNLIHTIAIVPYLISQKYANANFIDQLSTIGSGEPISVSSKIKQTPILHKNKHKHKKNVAFQDNIIQSSSSSSSSSSSVPHQEPSSLSIQNIIEPNNEAAIETDISTDPPFEQDNANTSINADIDTNNDNDIDIDNDIQNPKSKFDIDVLD